MKDKKIIFITSTLSKYSETWLERQIEMLQENICCIFVYNKDKDFWKNKIPIHSLSSDFIQPFYVRVLNKFKIHFWDKKKPSSKDNIEQILIKNPQIEVVYIHFLTNAVHLKEFILQTDKKVFVHCHGYDITWNLHKPENPNEEYYNGNYIKDIQAISNKIHFVANSRNTVKKLNEINIPDQQITLKYLGVRKKKEINKREKKNSLKILYVGRLVDFKGGDLLIKAFDLACTQGLDASLFIIGDGVLRVTCELLKFHSAYSNKIHILGSMPFDNVQVHLENADIFAAHNCLGRLSKQEEALGVSILEAMAYGLPIITAKSGGVQETVINGETGILVEPYNIEAQAQAFLYLANNPDIRYKMGLEGQKRIEKYFSYKNEKQEILKILGINE